MLQVVIVAPRNSKLIHCLLMAIHNAFEAVELGSKLRLLARAGDSAKTIVHAQTYRNVNEIHDIYEVSTMQ